MQEPGTETEYFLLCHSISREEARARAPPSLSFPLCQGGAGGAGFSSVPPLPLASAGLQEGPLLTLCIFFPPQALYMFYALAIVCDDFFVPSLEKICEVGGRDRD